LLQTHSIFFATMQSFILEPHNPAWLLEFARNKPKLEKILTNVPILTIEHVGSTSVPELLAKPILDIDILVTAPNVSAASDALVKAGYTFVGDGGIPHRYMFRQPGYRSGGTNGTKIGDEMKRNTYVVVEGSQAVRNHRDTKRMLMENPGLRIEYGNVKKRLLESGVTMVEYCKGKNDVCLSILRAAGWREEELEEIRNVNL
jgi:GrpB-like predicted nucleotidyltransferase (UPF0157 family)